MDWNRKDFSASTAEITNITTVHNRSQPCFDLVNQGLRLSLLLEPDITLVNKMERTKRRSSRQRYRMKFAQNVQGKALQNVYFTKVADLKCYQ